MSQRERGNCLWTGLGVFWGFLGLIIFVGSFGLGIVVSVFFWILAVLCFILSSASDREAKVAQQLEELQRISAGLGADAPAHELDEITFCGRCGQEAAIDSAYCAACGWPLHASQEDRETVASAPAGPTFADKLENSIFWAGRGLRSVGRVIKGWFIVDDGR